MQGSGILDALFASLILTKHDWCVRGIRNARERFTFAAVK